MLRVLTACFSFVFKLDNKPLQPFSEAKPMVGQTSVWRGTLASPQMAGVDI